jgi:AraC family transcriptional activator of pobA
MPTQRPHPPKRNSNAVRQVDFHKTKYGRELLVDVAWLHEMPTFLIDEPHSLRFHEILLVTRGSGVHWLDGMRSAVRPGTVLFTRPGEVRNWKVRDLDGICLCFPALFVEEFFQDPLFLDRLPYFRGGAGPAALPLKPAASSRLRRKLLAMRRELKAPRRDTVPVLRAQLHELLVLIAREHAQMYRHDTQPAPHRLTTKYRALVERDSFRRHQVGDYARQLGVSAAHLNVLCKRHLGMPAKRVIHDRIAAHARRMLLYTSDSAQRIAQLLGFEDPSYFTRFFRRISGCPPGQFRRRSAA